MLGALSIMHADTKLCTQLIYVHNIDKLENHMKEIYVHVH